MSFLIAFGSYSQNNDGIEICLQYQKSLKSFISDKEAEDALNKILNVIGASRNFLLVSCDEIRNALAITFKGERYILYDKDFIDKIEDMTNDWSGLFILAHEIGHHINGHTRDFLLAEVLDEQSKEKQREEELEADEFAGFIVANLGAKYNELSELLDLIGSNSDDSYSTHPNKDKRRLAVKKGFDKYQPKVIVTTSNKTNTNPIIERKTNIVSKAWTYKEVFFRESFLKKKRAELGRELNFFDKKDINDLFEKKRYYDYRKTGEGIGYSYRNNEIRTAKLTIEQTIYPDGSISKNVGLEDYEDMPDFVYSVLWERAGRRGVMKALDDKLEKAGYRILDDVIYVEFDYVIDNKYYGKVYSYLEGWRPQKFNDDRKMLEKKLIEAKRNTSKPLRYFEEISRGEKTYQVLMPRYIQFSFAEPEEAFTYGLFFYENKDIMPYLAEEKNIAKKKQEEFIRQLKSGNKLYLRIGKSPVLLDKANKAKESLLKTPYVYEFDLKGSSKALNLN